MHSLSDKVLLALALVCAAHLVAGRASPPEPSGSNGKRINTTQIDEIYLDQLGATTEASSPTSSSVVAGEETLAPSELQATSASSRQSNSKRINMTQVDEVYVNGRKTRQETIEGWNQLHKRLKGLVGRVIGTLVPQSLNMTQEARISGECQGAMLKWILNLNQLKSWALRMFDASGKPIAGMLEGAMTSFGNYRECLKIRAPDEDEMAFTGKFHEHFRGKYCIIQTKPWLPKLESPYYNLNSKIKGIVISEEPELDYVPTTTSASSDTNNNRDDSVTGEPTTMAPPVAETDSSAANKFDQNIFDELSDWILSFNFVNARMDMCIPSSCSREDIQKMINYFLKGVPELKARVLRCETEPPAGSAFGAAVIESGPEQFEGAANVDAASFQPLTDSDSETDLDGDQQRVYFSSAWSNLGWLLVPGMTISLVLAASFWSFAMDRGLLKRTRITHLHHTLTSLSLKRSIGSHLKLDYEQLADDKPLALYGLKFIFVLWIINTESAINLKFEYLRELMMLKELVFWWPLQWIINSTLQFDSIILLTAFSMGYKMSPQQGINQSSSFLKSTLRFVLDKYVRLMPSIMVMVALAIVRPLLYMGPVWNDYTLRQSAVCRSTGWLNTVFLQNYLPYQEICLPQTWLIAVEFQLIVLASPLIYCLNKSIMSRLINNDKNNNARSNGSRSLWPSSGVVERLSDRGRSPTFDSDSTTSGCSSSMSDIANPIKKCQAPSLDSIAEHKQQQQQEQNDDTAQLDSEFSASSNVAAQKPLYWLRTLPGFMLVLCMLLGAAGSFYNVYSNQLPPAWFYTMADPESKATYFGAHLMLLWPHISVFALGLIAGLECRRVARNIALACDLSNRRRRHEQAKLRNKNNKKNANLSRFILSGNKQFNNQHHHNSNDSYENDNDNGQLKGHHNQLLSASLPVISMDGPAFSSSPSTTQPAGFYSTSDTQVDDYEMNRGMRRGGDSMISLLLHFLGLLLAITTMLIIIFSTYNWSIHDLPEPLIAASYDTGSRFLWSLALIYILYLVSVPANNRKFGFMARSLGQPLMVFLGKLSFLIYLIYPFVHTTVLAIQEQPIYSSWLMLTHILIGNITITVILASIMSIFVEMPCRNLFRRCGTSLHLLTSSSSSRLL